MPSITFSFDDLCLLVGKRLSEAELTHLLDYAKAELDSKFGSEITVKYNDTNQPYLWCVEGLARLLKGVLGRQKGLAKITLKKSAAKIIVDKRVRKLRPYIAGFIAKGVKLDDYLLKQLVQMQEKLSSNFGRKRAKISIGTYPLNALEFPVHYKLADPLEKFIPLSFHHSVSLREVLDKHEKGKEFGHLLKAESGYPVLVDAKKDILSLIPIINSEQSGRLVVGDDSFFFEVTGTDERAVNLVANSAAFACFERGFELHSLVVEYPERKIVTPTLTTTRMKFKEVEVEKLLGIKLKAGQLKSLLEGLRYGYANGTAVIPSYRHDVMHAVDIVEDVAIMYGYDNFETAPLTSFTVGNIKPMQRMIDTFRELWVGAGYQELLSPVLINKELLYGKMHVLDKGTVELENFVSMTYSCVRSWFLPILLEILSKNKHVEYPQKIFEQGVVTLRTPDLHDEEHIAGVSAHSLATFTEGKQVVQSILQSVGALAEFEEFELGCFIPGRAASVVVNGTEVGFLGEIHPQVLDEFGLLTPVVATELNLSKLHELLKK